MADIGVPSVYFSRGNDADRGRLGLHDTDLDGGGMGPQDHVIGDIERILHVCGRVVSGYIECLKIIIVQFHIGTFYDPEPHPHEYGADLSYHLRKGMEVSPVGFSTGQGDIHQEGPFGGPGLYPFL